MTQPSTIEVPAYKNILQYTADFIFEKFDDRTPDFSNLFVLLPHSQVTQQFKTALFKSLQPDVSAIIPPWFGTLKSWARQFSSNQHSNYPIISEHARQLLFIEALQQHPDLFKEENQWQVTQALLSLFDELSLNQTTIFTSAEDFQDQLQHAYGFEEQQPKFQHLLNESNLVYTLWQAWQLQLSENNLYDEISDYISRLSNATATITKQDHFICLSTTQYSKVEQDFIENLIHNNQCSIIEFENTIATDDASDNQIKNHQHIFSTFINETFKQLSPAIKQRAEIYAKEFCPHSSSELPLSVYMAADEETQIRAIDYFVRINILNNNKNIAIISEDRKLSRRLRALLERSNIQLQDNAGWSLATTQAATSIERWLQCIEEDFSAYPLLDCLKSPFLNIIHAVLDKDATDADFKKNVYRFEHDLIFHENVSSNIKQYKSLLKNRLQRLDHWPANSYDELINTLDYIQKTAKPLSVFYTENKKIALSEFINALFNSMQHLGIVQSYQHDEAGLVLLKTFEELKQSIKHSDPLLSWDDCRIWLGMALESQHFTPPTNNTNVQLMTLEQASHLNFDCIVIAAAESQHFPGSANNSPFFNQAVHASLELTTWEKQYKQRHELFNRTLLSAPEVLLTACNEEKGEEKPVSPWLELLISFHQLAFNKKADYKSLNNEYLQQLVQSKNEVFNCDDNELPEQSKPPCPVIPQHLIPEKISASSYQRIVNCPYQYFSADGLRLKALEELTDELRKSDYGERIHLILQTFHNGDKKYGEKFSDTITDNNRSQAESFLSQLSEKIFLTDLENNVLHRSWLYRWKKHIPAYISWQIRHQLDWNIYLSEEKLERDLDDSLKIYGRLDRIDRHMDNSTHAIIDYKTGKTARQEDVDIGENVQLSTYALLDEKATNISYLSVDSSSQKVESKAYLSDDNLQINREENKQRLIEIFKQIRNKERLHAWGDNSVCHFCHFSGLCRKAEWSE